MRNKINTQTSKKYNELKRKITVENGEIAYKIINDLIQRKYTMREIKKISGVSYKTLTRILKYKTCYKPVLYKLKKVVIHDKTEQELSKFDRANICIEIINELLMRGFDMRKIATIIGVSDDVVYKMEERMSATEKMYNKFIKFYKRNEKAIFEKEPSTFLRLKFKQTSFRIGKNTLKDLINYFKRNKIPATMRKYYYDYFISEGIKKDRDKYKKYCKDIYKHFGKETQIKKLLEEFEELKLAIINNDEENMHEEMADVLVLITQLFNPKTNAYFKEKVLRTKERIKTGYYESEVK